MSLPSVSVVRERIERLDDNDMRLCLMATYLFAARISEVISETYTAKNPAYGKQLEARLDSYHRRKAVIWTVHTAKREGKPRLIALPLDPRYEPWANPLYLHCRRRKPFFPYARQYVGRYVRESKVFKGLTYPIETYVIIHKSLGLYKKVDRHTRAFTIHALRHLRATELVEYYGFDGFNLAAYGGWTIKTATGAATSMFDRYLSLGWQSYFPKLLKRRVSS